MFLKRKQLGRMPGFPNFNLEDKLIFNRDGIVTNKAELENESHMDTSDNMDKQTKRELVMPKECLVAILKRRSTERAHAQGNQIRE